ncbi:MAG: ATPase, partial [Clostridia bacterium]|nr:ATPase [Clostridia bacterium]
MTDINLANTFLGIEFGSTRIKGVLIDDNFNPVASGAYDWENRFENGYWTYSVDDFMTGMQGCFASLAADVKEKFGKPLDSVAAIGISGMMHGYLAFDKDDNLLVPFRTWRNTTTGEAAEELSALLNFNIPQRWSISHLYQALLNKEEHVKDVAFFTT